MRVFKQLEETNQLDGNYPLDINDVRALAAFYSLVKEDVEARPKILLEFMRLNGNYSLYINKKLTAFQISEGAILDLTLLFRSLNCFVTIVTL